MNLNDQIKESLISLLAGIKASDGGAISREMVVLDQILENSDGAIHPQLAHFLGNRSYAKAMMFLDGEKSIPAGTCGGRAGQPKSP